MPSHPDAPGPSPVARRTVLLPVAAGLATASLPALAQSRGQPARSGTARAPTGPAPTPATTPLGPVDTTAKLALIVDADTGAVLLEKNADERMPPSSMSKLMTMYIVFEHAEGRAG